MYLFLKSFTDAQDSSVVGMILASFIVAQNEFVVSIVITKCLQQDYRMVRHSLFVLIDVIQWR